MIKFEILGQPIAKARPRMTKAGVAYTPQRTTNYESLVRYTYQSLYGNREPLKGRIEAHIVAVFPVPKSYSKKLTTALLSGSRNYDKKPDCDNLAKSVLDALNGIAYNDDSQITSLHVVKEYGIQPKVIIELEEI